MEGFILFCLFLFFIVIFGLFIWIVVLQQQVSSLSDSIKRLNNYIKRLEQTIQSKDITVKAEPEHIKPEQVSSTSQSKPVVTEPSETPVLQKQVNTNIPVQSIKETLQYNHVTENKSSESGFEKAFLGNIFNKIGALAIIIATIIFIKLVSPFIVLTPLMKTILGFIAGLGMVSGALYMHRKDNLKNYAEVLLGTGFAVLFITNYCAYSLFHIFNTFASIISGTLFMVAAYFIADKMKTLSMLIIGLIGAYLTPFFAGSESNVVLSYLILINMVSLIYTLRNKKTNYVNIVNLIITLCIYSWYHFTSPMNISYPITLWTIYIIYDLLRDKNNEVDTVLCYINYGVLTFFSTVIFKDAHTALGWLLLSTAVVYAVLSRISRFMKNNLYKTYEYSVLINVWLFIYFVCKSDIVSVISWSVIALVVSYLIPRFKADYLKSAVNGYFFMAFIGALFAHYDSELCFLAHYTPLFNIRTLVFLIPAVSMITSSRYIIKQKESKTCSTLLFSGFSLIYLYFVGEINSLLSQYFDTDNSAFNKTMMYIILGFVYTLHAKRFYNINKLILFNIFSYIVGCISLLTLFICTYIYPSGGLIPLINLKAAAFVFAIVTCLLFNRWSGKEFYKYMAVVIGFFMCHSECVTIYKNIPSMEYIISLGWVLYSGLSTIYGILKNKKFLINTGIVLSILTILRIFIYDLSAVEAIYKLIAFLALGVILMLISYIYTSNKKKN